MLKQITIAALASVALLTIAPAYSVESNPVTLTDEMEETYAGYSDSVWGYGVGGTYKDEFFDISSTARTVVFDDSWDEDFLPTHWTNSETYEPVRILNEDDHKQIKCLTDNLYYEARGEPRDGQIAVVDVVFNRANSDSSLFPGTTPCEIVYQRNRRGCQFSWVCGHGYGPVRDRKLYDSLQVLVTDLYINPEKMKVTDGALWYHADYVSPRWSRVYKLSATYGRHRFYEE